MGHFKDGHVDSFLRGELKPSARRRIVRHLLSGCADCRARVQAAALPGMLWSLSAAEPDEVYDACIDRAREAIRPFEARWNEDQERCGRAMDLVQSKGWDSLTRAERQSFRGTWSHVEMLLRLSFEARHRDPQEMLYFADSALEVADRLQPEPNEVGLLNDLKARVWAEVGNACRVNEAFGRAAAAFKKARTFLENGTGDLFVQARIDETEASLANLERKVDRAETLLDRAYRAYMSLGERHLAGRTLVTKALCLTIADRPSEAVPVLRQALSLLDELADPQLVAMAQHNLLFAMVEAGELREASQLLLESGLRQKFANDSLNLLRVRWVEGKILAGRGRLGEAERALGDVRKGFCERDLEFTATIVGLDLAKVILQQGDSVRLHELAKELVERARNREMHREARNALYCFEIVCRLRVATLENVERVRGFLDRLYNSPSLRWQAELLFFG